jgi:hypothetical protein
MTRILDRYVSEELGPPFLIGVDVLGIRDLTPAPRDPDLAAVSDRWGRRG